MTETSTEPTGRPGRWRSGAQSKQRILESARTLFRAYGYDDTTVRAIAAEANVDPAMVYYFFDSKQGLFAAAAEMPANVPHALDLIFEGGLDEIGDRIIRTLVENLDASDRPLALLLSRSAPGHDESELIHRQFIAQGIVTRLAELLGTPDASLRAGMVSVQILGLAVARYVVREEPIASASVDELVERFGPIAQNCLTGSGPDASSSRPN